MESPLASAVYVLVIDRRVFHMVSQEDIDALAAAILADASFADVSVSGTVHRVAIRGVGIGWAVNRTGGTPNC
jgi:hypothetical protein